MGVFFSVLFFFLQIRFVADFLGLRRGCFWSGFSF
jgi:hypothetical protein